MRAGLDPFGFFGKYQGIQIKGKLPDKVAIEVVQTLLNKPQHRSQLLECITKSFATFPSQKKIDLIRALYSWEIITDIQMKTLLERAALSEYEKKSLSDLIAFVKAFSQPAPQQTEDADFDDIPF